MSALQKRPLPLIHINGFPAAGKLTIARALQAQLHSATDGAVIARLVHNHLLINPADAVLHRTEPGYQILRKALRDAVFTSLISPSAPTGAEPTNSTYDKVYIFTDFQSGDPLGSAVCAEYLATAKARGSQLISIVLSCEDEEVHLARLQASERREAGKLVDAELLKTFRCGAGVHQFRGEGAEDTKSWVLEVSQLSVDEAARRILEYIYDVCPDIRGLVVK